MALKIWFKDTIITVSLLEIQLKVKFEAELDISIKLGSKKEEFLTGLVIKNGKVKIPPQINSQSLKQINKQNDTAKIAKSLRFLFDLRSKSYNAYAGEVQINLNIEKNQRVKHQVKIDYCIDENASFFYEVMSLTNQKGKSQITQKSKKNKKIDSEVSEQLQSSTNLQENKFPSTQTQAKNQKHFLQLPQSQNLFSVKNQHSNVVQSGQNTSKIKKKKTNGENYNILMDESSFDLSKIQSIEEISSITRKNIPQNVGVGSAFITKQMITLENKLYQEKQKCLKLQVELQKSKNQSKQLLNQLKVPQSKLQSIQTELKKVKNQQIALRNQNILLKQSNEVLTQKLNQKNQQIKQLKNRNQSYQKLFKEELKNVYQKLETVHQEKQSKNFQRLNLQEKLGHFEKKHNYQLQHKELNLQMERDKLIKNIKKVQKQYSKTQNFFDKSIKQIGQHIELIFRNEGDIPDLFAQGQVQNKYTNSFREIVAKIKKISVEMHSQIDELNETIKKKDAQIKELKRQIRQLSQNLVLTQHQFNSEKLDHKKTIQKFQTIIEEQKSKFDQQKKQLKSIILMKQAEINKLNDKINAKQKQISYLKTVNDQNEQTIIQLNETIVYKTQDFKNQINQLNESKNQLSNQLQNEISELENKLDQQKTVSSQLTKKNQNLTKTLTALFKQKSLIQQKHTKLQKQLQKTNQLASLLLKQMTEFRNFVEPLIPDKLSKKDKILLKRRDYQQELNIFQQNLKVFQQAKKIFQNKLQLANSEILALKQQIKKQKRQYKNIDQLLNPKQYQKFKAQNERQLNIKIKKLNQIVESLNAELQVFVQQHEWAQSQVKNIYQTIIDLEKSLNSKNMIMSQTIKVKPIKDAIDQIKKIVDLISEKFLQTKSKFEESRKERLKNIISLKRIEKNDSFMNNLSKKRPSWAINIGSKQKALFKQQLQIQNADQTKTQDINMNQKLQKAKSLKTLAPNQVMAPIEQREEDLYDKIGKNTKNQEPNKAKREPDQKEENLNKVTSVKKLQSKVKPFKQLKQINSQDANETKTQEKNINQRLQKAKSLKTLGQNQVKARIEQREENPYNKIGKDTKNQESNKAKEEMEQKEENLKKVRSVKNLQSKVTPFKQLRQKYVDKTPKEAISAKNAKVIPNSK